VSVIVHLSDLHFGAQLDELVEPLLVDIWDHRPDLVVVSGDLTQRARRHQFDEARAFLDRLPGPVLTVVGNHDLPLFDVLRRLASPTGRYEKLVTSALNPVVDLSGLVVVGLDSMPSWRWKAGHVSERQADLVRNTLGSSPSGAWRVLVTHHPVLPENLSALLGRRRLVEACDQARVTVLLSGHTHRASVDIVTLGDRGAHTALSVVAGTAISSRTRRAANAYSVVELSDPMHVGATATVRIHEANGATWSAAQSTTFGVGAEGMVVTAQS